MKKARKNNFILYPIKMVGNTLLGPVSATCGQQTKKKKMGRPRTRTDVLREGENYPVSLGDPNIDLILAQMIDDAIILNCRIDNIFDYRRRRSLMFRSKMRNKRAALYKDPLFKPNRTSKNSARSKQAKRRWRNKQGQFKLRGQLSESHGFLELEKSFS